MHYFDWLPHFAPSGLADWFILLICVYEAFQTRQEQRRRAEHPVVTAPLRRLHYWPWVILAILVTLIAWGPVAAPYFLTTPSLKPLQTTSIKEVKQTANLRAEVANLKDQLHGANDTIDQLRAKLATTNGELHTAKTENTRTTDQRHHFCQSSLLTQFQTAAMMFGRAGDEFQRVNGETCITASCYAAGTKAKNSFLSNWHTTLKIRQQLINALALPNEANCIALPPDAPYELFQ